MAERGKCLHTPRRLVTSGRKHKDGSPLMVCADCKGVSQRQSRNRKIGYHLMWDRQDGRCAFCDEPLADDNTTHREHNHKTGEERGLVHARCNQMISGIEDAMDLIGIERVIKWMQEH